MAAYLLLALLSYHPADPGWSQTSWQGEVKNLAGSAGAWLADITMFTFGAFSYLVPPWWFYWAGACSGVRAGCWMWTISPCRCASSASC
ncbi:DNA translocase FtsK 4TM domain-containing protein [Aeromonas salmonicida]|nr:DNA translocase FtsK 4TM domain-containing protein [Aeromonas salmonicida]MDF8331384.1 DNA translocase FtsK 4TM domain-containing protein [Aeromonas salmonicida]WCB56736.1 DNA translocase FtsK 4TM domain-containing protein [Aeromonas salmonicida subsp. salmonicida]